MAALDPSPPLEPPRKKKPRSYHYLTALEPQAIAGLYEALRVRNWTQKRLALEAEVTENTVVKILRGQRVFHKNIVKVARTIANSDPDQAVDQLLKGRLK